MNHRKQLTQGCIPWEKGSTWGESHHSHLGFLSKVLKKLLCRETEPTQRAAVSLDVGKKICVQEGQNALCITILPHSLANSQVIHSQRKTGNPRIQVKVYGRLKGSAEISETHSTEKILGFSSSQSKKSLENDPSWNPTRAVPLK